MPKPIKMTAPAADPDGLRQAYEWMAVDREASLRLALDWYGANAPALLFGDPMDADRLKAYDRAEKSRMQGEHTTFPEERKTAWATALRLLEKAYPGKGLPTVMEAQQAADMGSQPTRRVTDVKTVVDMLNAAYAGCASFRMTFGGGREFDGEEVLVPVEELRGMVPMTPLKIALRELPTVAKVLSVALDPDTNEKVMDGARFMAALPALHDRVADWAASNDVSRRAVGRAHVTSAPKARTVNGGPAKVSSARNNPKVKFRDADVIRVPAPFVNGNGRAGKAGRAFDLLRDGMTFAQYRAAVLADNPKNGAWYVLDTLRWALAHGMASIA